MFTCDICSSTFTRQHDLKRHKYRLHSSATLVYECALCGLSFGNVKDLHEHRATHRINPDNKLVLQNEAFNGSLETFSRPLHRTATDVKSILLATNSDLLELLKLKQESLITFKCQLILTVEFKKLGPNGEVLDLTNIIFRTKAVEILRTSDINTIFIGFEEELEHRVDTFCEQGSGWILEDFIKLEVNICKVKPLVGYSDDLPPRIKYFKDISKLKDEMVVSSDGLCFYRALASYYMPHTDDPETLMQFAYNNFKLPKPLGPMLVKDIEKFEKANVHLNIRLNVLISEAEEVYPLYSSKTRTKNSVSLFLCNLKHTTEKSIQHYMLIEDLDLFVRKVYKSDGSVPTYQKTQVCGNCLNKFYIKADLDQHLDLCLQNKTQRVTLSENDIEFKKFNNKFPLEYIIFWDTESSMSHNNECEKCGLKCLCGKKTLNLEEQKPISYSMLVMNKNKDILFKKTFTGENCMSDFVDELLAIENQLGQKLDQNIPMTMTPADHENFIHAVTCHICDEVLHGDRVRDHDHLSGVYMGAAHSQCNIHREVKKVIPVVAHGFSAYDSHHLIDFIARSGRAKDLAMKILPYNTERVRTVSIKKLHFIDSFAFISTSLENMAKDLVNSNHDFKILKAYGLTGNSQETNLLLQKGVFPYEFATSISKLKNSALPNREAFFSKVRNSHISEDEYKHAQEVYKTFRCQNMLEYMELYEQLDVILLAESFMNFREMVQREWRLDCW